MARDTLTWGVHDAGSSVMAEDIPARRKVSEVFRVVGGATAASILRRCSQGARRARHHPADGRRRADCGCASCAGMIWWMRRRSARLAQRTGEGIDALEGLPLTALTKSPKLKSVASEAIGGDTRIVRTGVACEFESEAMMHRPSVPSRKRGPSFSAQRRFRRFRGDERALSE